MQRKQRQWGLEYKSNLLQAKRRKKWQRQQNRKLQSSPTKSVVPCRHILLSLQLSAKEERVSQHAKRENQSTVSTVSTLTKHPVESQIWTHNSQRLR